MKQDELKEALSLVSVIDACVDNKEMGWQEITDCRLALCKIKAAAENWLMVEKLLKRDGIAHLGRFTDNQEPYTTVFGPGFRGMFDQTFKGKDWNEIWEKMGLKIEESIKDERESTN